MRQRGAFRRRFIAESRAAAAVDDPHIIPVYEAGEADGVLFIAMRVPVFHRIRYPGQRPSGGHGKLVSNITAPSPAVDPSPAG